MFAEYQDWIIIGAVVVAFFIFLGWNKSRQTSVKDRKRRNFKQSLRERKAEREKNSEH
jgi:FtsZ-interacting cell division protein ZipA